MRLRLAAATALCVLAACSRTSERSLIIAVNAGVEGSALKSAAQEWGAAKGVKVEVAEWPCLDVCRNPYRSGRYYALPYVGNSQLFFYRKDLFEKHKLAAPSTWREVLAAAKTISEKEKMFGYVM